MKDLQKNIVPAENQNIGDYFPRGGGNGIRVLFVGNSITKHAPKPEIGWTRDCGMAASCLEKDYVHLTVEKIKQYDPQVNFSILQVANFERNFETFDIQKLYKPAIDYKADIIIMFFGTNVDKKYSEIENPEIKFGDKYEELRNALNSHGAATVIHGQCFYIRSVINAEKKAVAERLGVTTAEYAMVDDNVQVLQTARKAGAYTIGMHDSFSKEDVVRAACDRYIYSFDELLQ